MSSRLRHRAKPPVGGEAKALKFLKEQQAAGMTNLLWPGGDKDKLAEIRAVTDKPIWVALVQTASTLPVFLLGLPSGALADGLDRKRIGAGREGDDLRRKIGEVGGGERPVGAGDAFLAALLVSKENGALPKEALQNAVAARTERGRRPRKGKNRAPCRARLAAPSRA